MTEAAGERWVTVVEIAAARQRYTARIPGYEAPVAVLPVEGKAGSSALPILVLAQ